MKTILITLALAFTGLEIWAQSPPAAPDAPTAPAPRRLPTRVGTQPGQPQAQPPVIAPMAPTSPGADSGVAAGAAELVKAQPEEVIPAGTINFQGVDVNQVLDIYAQLVGRTLLRAGLPAAQIVLKTQTPLTKSEAIQALQAVLALNGIAVVNIGDKFVKVLPVDQANTAGAEIDMSGSTNLPSLGSYVTHIVQLNYVKPTKIQPIIQNFAKLPNSIFPIDDNGIIVIRDNAENVKRMLEMIEKVDVSVPAEYISEVIPIRYAKVDDIATALNALGGAGGGATVSIGSAPASTPISGLRSGSLSGMGSMGGGIGGGGFGNSSFQPGGMGQNRPFSATTPTTSASGAATTGTSFAQRLNTIIQRASGTGTPGQQDQIQLFGQTKIIPNNSSSSLLVYATRQDMQVIKEIIGKLDVPLAQVLIEAIIMDVTIGNQFDFGVSAAQNPTKNGKFTGAGGYNNGSTFLNFATNVFSSGSNSVTSFFPSTLPSGNGQSFSYFGNIGPLWDVAVKAAESDSRANIIQRPRIQTSQALPAQFFVGSSVPYKTSTYVYSGQSGDSYSQLSVGVELDVTPFINPEGAVTMQIQQEIDEIAAEDYNGSGQPSTIKRTLNTTITVRDKDTVMLGGFIKSKKETDRSGVPYLKDIPLIGNLFTSRSDIKNRSELIVLMRPTVLPTPEIAARNTIKESQRLPGASAAAAEDADYERALIEAERKKELKDAKRGKSKEGFYNLIYGSETDTNSVTAPTNSPAADADQDKARAALEEKMTELDSQKAEPVSPSAPK